MQTALALALSIALAGPTADEIAEAEAHRDEAIAAFNAGDFEVAIEAFEAAYGLDPEPSYLFNIGRVYEEAGQAEEALSYYERFAAAPNLSSEERARADDRIRALQETVGETQPDPPPETDDDSTGSTEPDTVAATTRVIESKDGAPRRQKRARPLVIAGATVFSIAGAATIGTGVGFALVGEDRRDLRLALLGSTAGAGAVAVVGVVLMAVGLARRAKTRRSIYVRPVWTPRTRGVAVGARF